MVRQVIRNILVLAVCGLSCGSALPSDGDLREGPLLSTFRGVQEEDHRNTDGSYHFAFSLPQQARTEQRDSDGTVRGHFAFVDNVGEEFSVKYDADHDGFRPESDALPQNPDDTDEVQRAREDFLRHYEETVKYLDALGSDESDYDYDDSESSEESYEYGDDDDSSSEEDDDSESESDESDEEDEDEDDDDEEEEEEEHNARFTHQNSFNKAFGFRARQQQLGRAGDKTQARPAAERRAIIQGFPPAAAFFGRRASINTQ